MYVVRLVMEVVKLVANTMAVLVEIRRLVADSFAEERYAAQPLPSCS